MKKITSLSLVILFSIGTLLFINGCAATETVTAKSGAQIWGENCLRCHNAPDPVDYSDAQWETVGMHMKQRVNNLTEAEINKVVEFLQSAN
ncbi:MAG: cytochrome c [Bacteroidota bacterium]